MVFNKIKSYN